MLYLGITGKMQLWKTLERTANERLGDFDFAQLAERAARQREMVDELHFKGAEWAFPTPGAAKASG